MKFKLLKLAAFLSLSYLPIGLSADCQAEYDTEEIIYDNFNDGGASYSAKWETPFYGFAGETYFEDGGSLLISFPKGKLKVSSPEFQWSSNVLFYDHIKYFAVSREIFSIPDQGSIEFSADIKAKTFNTIPGLVMSADKVSDQEEVRYLLNEGRQAGVTLHMLNYQETGVLFDWFVYGNQAFALYERLFDAPVYPADLETAFTQIVGVFDISSKTHNFAIRYFRDKESGKDKVEYLIDGKVKAKLKDVGIPINLSESGVYPAVGPGERVIDLMTGMIIGHGLLSLLDVFPFGQGNESPITATTVSIPLRGPFPNVDVKHPIVNSRLWGQGAEGEFNNFKVITRTKNTDNSSS